MIQLSADNTLSALVVLIEENLTRQRYSKKESLNRILLSVEGKPVGTDVPDSIQGNVLSEDEALSDIAELLAGSLPNETATLPSSVTVPVANIPTGSFSSPSHIHDYSSPSHTHDYSLSSHTHSTYDLRVYDDNVFKATGTAISFDGNFNVLVSGTSVFVSPIEDSTLSTLQVGTSPNYAYIESDGTFRLTGSATAWEDLRIDGLSTRVGAVAPTDETGFRGDANFFSRNFVHNQADEIQFQVQMPHAWKLGSEISPHVHVSPWITGTQAVQAVKFVLEYYWANINDDFPPSPSTVNMLHTWTGSYQWKHILAEHDADINGAGKGLSSILKCRLYRDNSVANNLAGKVAFLYFDLHYEVDSFGSSQEYVK